MENKKGSGIFLGVIGVATLIVAIIGATFAFFSANAASEETAIGSTGAVLKLGYADDDGVGLKVNLIPAEDVIAHYGATNTAHIEEKGRCLDDVGNEICSYYEFVIGNPSFTTQQGLYGNIKISSSDFTNLVFEILDETGKVVVGPLNFNDETRNDGNVIALPELTQQLLPSRLDDVDRDGVADAREEGDPAFDETNPNTYTPICEYDGTTCTQTNVRKYTMILWIRETGGNQTEADSGKVFAAGINFTSASDKEGVTGVIAAAKADSGSESGTTEEAATSSAE